MMIDFFDCFRDDWAKFRLCALFIYNGCIIYGCFIFLDFYLNSKEFFVNLMFNIMYLRSLSLHG